mgnify:CR=1 FL=1
MMAEASNEKGKTALRAGSAELEASGGTFYPFFMSSVVAGLVPPFSDFFYSVLSHYKIHALHLHPNSVLLLSIFAFYCEAFVGVMPSVALLRHFFYLRNKEGQCSGCANFVAANGTNAISKAGKKVEGFRNKWVLMDAKCSYPRLALPTGMPTPHEGWISAKLANPRAKQVLEKMAVDLKPDDPSVERLTGAMIIKEFMS